MRFAARSIPLLAVVLLALPATACGTAQTRPRLGKVYSCVYYTYKANSEGGLVLGHNGRYRFSRHHRGNVLTGKVNTGRYSMKRGVVLTPGKPFRALRIRWLSGPLKSPSTYHYDSWWNVERRSIDLWKVGFQETWVCTR